MLCEDQFSICIWITKVTVRIPNLFIKSEDKMSLKIAKHFHFLVHTQLLKKV
jgi:hypothetical protein